MKTPSIITALETRIAAELTPVNREQVFRDMLDEVYGDVQVASHSYSTSRALEELDPTAFRCGVADHFGTTDGYVEDIGPDCETYALDEAERVKAEFVAELEKERDEKQAMLDDADADLGAVDHDADDMKQAQTEVDDLNAKLDALEGHSF